MTDTTPLIRFAHPMAFQAFLRHIGAPVGSYLRRAGLPALCEEADVFVPVMRVWAFFDQVSARETRLLGWHVGEYVGDHALNANLLKKIEKAPTLLGALQNLVRFIRSEGSDVDIDIFERREDVLLYTHYWGLRGTPGYHVSQAYQLGVFLDLIRFFLGRDWVPDEIGLEAAKALPGLQERLPGTRILLRQPLGYIAIPRQFLHRKARHSVATDTAGSKPVVNKSFDYIESLRELVKAYLSEGYVSEKTAAGLMDTSVRTMTRTLALHGLSYGRLVDELRFEVAKKHLQSPDARLIDVAQSVGFKDQGNFTRMFRRIGGITPGRFRGLLQSEEPGIGPD